MKALLVSCDAEMLREVTDLLARSGITCGQADPGDIEEDAVTGVDALVVDLDSLDSEELDEPDWRSVVPTLALIQRLGSEDASRLANYDDFVTRAQLRAELIARLDRVVSGRRPHIVGAGFDYDKERRAATYLGHELSLSPRESEVLYVLLEANGNPLSRTELLECVWGIDFEPESKIVEVAIARLRAKIGARPSPIETVAGVGYRIPR